MKTYAIISGTEVVNIIDYEEQPTQPIPGLDPSYFAVLANDAGPGWTYSNGVFTAPQPYPSWTLINNVWTAPTPMPTDGKFYYWNETIKQWAVT
jgi:hypothetical protein